MRYFLGMLQTERWEYGACSGSGIVTRCSSRSCAQTSADTPPAVGRWVGPSKYVRRLIQLAVIVWIFVSGGARAIGAGVPVVVLFAPPGHEAVATRMIAQAAAQRSGTWVIDRSPLPPVRVIATTGLRQGIERYHALDYGGAMTALDDASKSVLSTGAHGVTPSQLSDLLIYRALVFAAQGDAARAWDEFVRAAVVDPSRRLDPARYAPRAVAMFQRAATTVTRDALTQIAIDVPAECRVWFDARSVVRGAFVSTPRGEHYLRVECADSAPFGGRVVVVSDGQRIRPGLRRYTPPTHAQMAALARRRGASVAVGVIVEPPTVTLHRVEVATGRRTEHVITSLGAPTRVALDAMLGRILSPVQAIPRLSRVAPRWYQRPWLWGAAGALLTAAVLIPLLDDDDAADTFNARVSLP